MYSDELEIVNPLGPSKSKHKLFTMYYNIMNLPQYITSQTDKLPLILLCKSAYVKKFGLPSILKPFMDELSELTLNEIEINNIQYTVKILGISGDNLGSHQIGGFCQNFSLKNFAVDSA